eukprot:NODE_3232_length_1253_cov_181.464602_g3068_i0.p1 GENE.NODE_3232_length_1253_cov_181.464602_g3068_i0~~NODE_3232_length_1253_cov_181.464602_g3068_i0.p1  ORF type:complete len:299 (-),score=37.73 NODE_3232_length_1253_cov_181.464602_g3068_i0:289-1185(-)
MCDVHHPHEEGRYTNTYYMVSGGVAGMVEHLSMFPVDTIKTHMQAQHKSSSVLEVCKRIWRDGGLRAFYRGVPSGMCGAFPSHAAYFTIYENMKEVLHPDKDHGILPIRAAMAGACATVGHDLCHTPFDVVKQRLQISKGDAGNLATLRSILLTEGPRALYRSLPTTILMNVPFSAVHFATYETVKQFLGARSDEEIESSFWKYTIAGGIGGTCGGIVSNPFDVVKTRQQLGVLPVHHVKKAFKLAYRTEGSSVFTRGLPARILYFAPSGAIAMTSYETAKWFLTRSRFDEKHRIKEA